MENIIKKFFLVFKLWLAIIETAMKNKKRISSLVTISDGNSKMGKVASVSLLPLLTCPKVAKETCGKKCYAKKLCMLRPSVLNAYAKNTAIQKIAIHAYFKAIDNAMKKVRFFRFHVSGDIPNKKYFSFMVKTANKNKHCEVLVFTKQFKIVNNFIENGGTIPENMHILFSGWTNLKPDNPYNLPETIVYSKTEEIKPDWILCGGNCLNCAVHKTHCWKAEKGQTIAFKIH